MEIKTSTRGYELVGVGEGEEMFAKVYADDVVASHRNKIPFDHADGSVTDEKIGTRTVTDATGKSVTASLTEHLENAYAGIKQEASARSAAISQEASARSAAITQEASARSAAITQEAQNRTAAINSEAQARTAADNALSQSLDALSSAAVKSVNGARPDGAGNVNIAVSADGVAARTYRQCIVNGNFRRGSYGWTENAASSAPCTLSVTTPGVAVMTVADASSLSGNDAYYYYRTLLNVGRSGQKSGNFRYFLRIIISTVSAETMPGWAYNGYGGVSMASFSLTRKNQFEMGGKTYSEYIGVCDNSAQAPYAFMLAPFQSLSPGEYTVLEQIAVELPKGDALYDASADELYGYFSEYKEGQYVL